MGDYALYILYEQKRRIDSALIYPAVSGPFKHLQDISKRGWYKGKTPVFDARHLTTQTFHLNPKP